MHLLAQDLRKVKSRWNQLHHGNTHFKRNLLLILYMEGKDKPANKQSDPRSLFLSAA